MIRSYLSISRGSFASTIFVRTSGKLYDDIRERVSGFKSEEFFIYRKKERGEENEQSQWKCVEFRDRRNSWQKTRRALNIIKLAHQRGEAELVHRNLKEFGFEQMPFKKFSSNHAFFQMMVLSFNLYESFKWDICQEVGVVALSAQPNTFRRTFIDIAGKIVRHGRKCILKVSNLTCFPLILWKYFKNGS